MGLSATGAVSRHRLDRLQLNKGNYLREKKGGGRPAESIQREVVRAASDTRNLKKKAYEQESLLDI